MRIEKGTEIFGVKSEGVVLGRASIVRDILRNKDDPASSAVFVATFRERSYLDDLADVFWDLMTDFQR